MAQKPHDRSQPSAILMYAHGATDLGRGRLSRSSAGNGADDDRDQLLAGGRRRVDCHVLVDRHTETGDLVDLGERFGQLVAVPLGHAARHDEARAVTTPLLEGEDRVDRLPASVVDERAGVDHHQIGVARVRGRLHPVGEQRPDQLVGVDLVLRAAERLDVEAL